MKKGWAILLFAIASHAGSFWNASSGASTMKFLYLKPSPRSAGLASAGVSYPSSPSELSRNPIAALTAKTPEIGWNQIVFSDKIDADFLSLYYALPWKDFAFSGALEFIGYGDLEGRDEEGFETGEFSASAYAISFGAAYGRRAFHYAVAVRFASQTIEDETAYAFLADGSVAMDLGKYLSVGASITNAGYVTEYESEHEVPPTALQAGLTWKFPIRQNFELAASSDLYRRADSEIHSLFGAELSYKKMLFLRAGYALRPDTEDGLSGGLGIRLDRVSVEYAYAANPVLGGDHHISIAVRF